MSTGEELYTSVLDNVVDPGIDTDRILALLNEGLLVLAGEVLLPSLETSSEVLTIADQNTADLPLDYHHGLFRAYNGVSRYPIRVLDSRGQLSWQYGDLTATGDVLAVTAQGGSLMYLPIPLSEATLTIYYYRMPTPYTDSTDTDAFNPVSRTDGELAIKYYAMMRLYDAIEDGIEGAKVNTQRYESLFYRKVRELRMKLREGQSHPKPPIIKASW